VFFLRIEDILAVVYCRYGQVSHSNDNAVCKSKIIFFSLSCKSIPNFIAQNAIFLAVSFFSSAGMSLSATIPSAFSNN
jgi:hypothetical protein